MAKTLLVGPDLEVGEKILAALDAAGFPVSVALWLYEADEYRAGRGEWNLLLSSPVYDKPGPKEAHHQLVAALSAAEYRRAVLSIRLEGNKHRLIKGLRKEFSKSKSVAGMRLGGHDIGGVWVDDAYVYRIK